MADEHFRKLERLYHGAPFAEQYDAELAVREREAELTMAVDERFFHPAGSLHGSVYFKALDDAAFFAANSVETEEFLYTTSFTIYFERPVSDGHVRAVGTLVNDNPRQLIAEAVAYDDEDRELARGSGTFAKSGVALDEDLGYE